MPLVTYPSRWRSSRCRRASPRVCRFRARTSLQTWLSASVAYKWVAINGGSSAPVTVNSVTVTTCTAAQVATLGGASSAATSLTGVLAAMIAAALNVLLF